MSVEKVSLNSFRCLLFFFFAGVGCLLPFISLHLKSSGLSTDEIRWISFTAPIFATLGPVFVGPLLDYLGRRRSAGVKRASGKNDRNGCIRSVLAATVLLTAVFYCLLLSVPVVQDVNARQQEASFVCNEYGASLVQEKCSELNCFRFPSEKAGVASLRNCRFNCNYPAHYGYIEGPVGDADVERRTLPPVVTTTVRTTTQKLQIRPEIDISNLDDFFGAEPDDDDGDFGSGEEDLIPHRLGSRSAGIPHHGDDSRNKNQKKRDAKGDSGLSLEESPHICHDRGPRGSRTCFVFTPNSAAFNVNVVVKPFHEDDRHCSYPLGGNFSCRIPRGLEKPNESCKVICDVDDVSAENVHLKSQCGQILNDPDLTFWSYLLFRSFGDLFFSASVAVFIGAALVAAGEEAGREFILPSLSYGLFATVVGYLHSDDLSPLHLENVPNFFLGIVGFGVFSLLALFVLIFATNLLVGCSDCWRTPRTTQLKHKGEFFGVLLVLVLMGVLWGPIYFHVPWHITDPGGLELYVGCAAAIGALLSVPFVWKAYKVVDYCGYSNILIGAFTLYILRYTGLLFIENPWVLSIIGGMEAITLCLMLFAAVFYVRHLVPKHLTFTSQSLVVAAHFCFGGGLGCLTSTLLSPYDLDLDLFPRNMTQVEVEPSEGEPESKPTYHLIYCVGAISSAVIAVLYFIAYHCCLKKRCLAPLYRSDHNGALPHESGESGMYTPLRIIRNGRQSGADAS